MFDAYLQLMGNPDFMHAVQAESHKRSMGMLQGVDHYYHEQIAQERTPSRVIWQKAAARLLDFGRPELTHAPAILCIPSLINKYYIMDLYPERSFVKWLRDQGIRPLVLDWGEPGARERQYHTEDYVYYLLLDALAEAARQHRGELHMLGYCMGGILALAAAQLKPQQLSSLILLATPWDFHHEALRGIWQDKALMARYEAQVMQQDMLPPVWIQTLFHMVNPWHFQQKFQRFPQMNAAERSHFMAVESWVNDGVPLARHVAKECLIDWPRKNLLMKNNWQVHGTRIDPALCGIQCLTIAPQDDRIVPLESAEALVKKLPDCQLLTPASGHVSMMVGKQAKAHCWQPIQKWIMQ